MPDHGASAHVPAVPSPIGTSLEWSLAALGCAAALAAALIDPHHTARGSGPGLAPLRARCRFAPGGAGGPRGRPVRLGGNGTRPAGPERLGALLRCRRARRGRDDSAQPRHRGDLPHPGRDLRRPRQRRPRGPARVRVPAPRQCRLAAFARFEPHQPDRPRPSPSLGSPVPRPYGPGRRRGRGGHRARRGRAPPSAPASGPRTRAGSWSTRARSGAGGGGGGDRVRARSPAGSRRGGSRLHRRHGGRVPAASRSGRRRAERPASGRPLRDRRRPGYARADLVGAADPAVAPGSVGRGSPRWAGQPARQQPSRRVAPRRPHATAPVLPPGRPERRPQPVRHGFAGVGAVAQVGPRRGRTPLGPARRPARPGRARPWPPPRRWACSS